MYEELIERLRSHNGWELNKTLDEAADAIEELSKPKWIMIESRPMNDEERREWSEKIGLDLTDDEAIIYTSQLPDDGQRVLVYSKYGGVSIDTFVDDDDGCYFEDNGDMDDIVAWMPRPEPPKEEK